MIRFRIQKTLSLLLACCLALPLAAQAQAPSCQGQSYNCFLLRAASADVSTVLAVHGLTEVVDVRPGEPVLKLVTGPANIQPEVTLAGLEVDPLVIAAELADAEVVSENAASATIDTTDPAFVGTLAATGTYVGPETSLFSSPLWNGYAAQPAVSLIKADLAHADPRPEALGLGVVAILDTGVDPDHPVLVDALVPGYDFVLDQPGVASEWAALDPATAAQDEADVRAIAEQSYTSILDGDGVTLGKGPAAETILEQSYTSILDDITLPDAFGHGTMVAGLVRLIAPGAYIMPLRVFDGDGHASLGQIVRAIYYAVDNGANVINMSFSTPEHSYELEQALLYAELNGVVAVASAGNEGYSWGPLCYLPGANCPLRYPAAFPNVIGTASSDQQDVRSDFTNRGLSIVMMAAPGEALVTTYPGGLYAGVWGTSFSSALAAGAISLMHDIKGPNFIPISYWQAYDALMFSSDDVGDASLGYGRLDVMHGMDCGLSGKPSDC